MPSRGERIIFPFGGFVAAALIRGTRARERVYEKAKTREWKRLDDDGGFDVGEMA